MNAGSPRVLDAGRPVLVTSPDAASHATIRTVGGIAPILLGSLVGALIAGRLETGALCAVVALVCAAHAGARVPRPQWCVVVGLGALAAWLLNIYLTPGTPLEGWPVVMGRAPTRDGLELGALLLLRALGAVASVQGLGALWPGERAADELAMRLAPLERWKVPVREMRVMIGLALRFAPLLRSEAARIGRLQALRAGRPPRGPGEWLQRRRAALVPTLVGALERAERVALALEARHYRLRPVAAPASRQPALSGTALAGWAVLLVALLWRR